MTIKDDRKVLESLINGSQPTIGSTPISPIDASQFRSGPSFDIDIDKIRRKSTKKAKRMIKNATGLVMTNELAREDPYLRDKMDMDIISLSGIIYQLEINEIMQASLLEEVRTGMVQARMYEVFGGLSKIIGELNKQLLQTIEAIKMTYKDVKLDIEDKNQELKAIGPSEGGIIRNKEGVIAMGTKELIKQTKKLRFDTIMKDDIQDVDDIPV